MRGTWQRHREWLDNLVALGISCIAVAFILFVLALVSDVKVEPPEQVTIRKVDFVLPAPPPPPPPEPTNTTRDMDAKIAVSLSGDSGGPQVAFAARPRLANVTLDKLPKPNLDDYVMNIHADMASSIRSFKVEQLDEMPQIISSRKSRIAKELLRQGIRTVEAKVDIVIDTRGRAHIRRIVDAGYPEMVPIIQEHIAALEFTIPKKNGQPVNGEYLFTIRFRELL